MKAITTKYHGPTNFRGARLTASDGDGNRVSIPYPDQFSGEACHFEAVRALCAKMQWGGKMIAGQTVPSGYVFVFLPPDLMLASRGRHSTDVYVLPTQESDRRCASVTA